MEPYWFAVARLQSLADRAGYKTELLPDAKASFAAENEHRPDDEEQQGSGDVIKRGHVISVTASPRGCQRFNLIVIILAESALHRGA